MIIPLASMAVLAVGGLQASPECPLCGTWKSAAAPSIENMEKSSVLSEKQRNGFRKLLGHLVVVYTSSHVRSYMDFQDNPDREPWKPYEILKRQGSAITLRDRTNGVWSPETTITLYGECFSLPVPDYGFSEHFCRISSSSK
jgi:hypothetical protein